MQQSKKIEILTRPKDIIVFRKIEMPVGTLTDKTRLRRPKNWDPRVRAYYSPNPYKLEYLVKNEEDLEKIRFLISRLYDTYPLSNTIPDYHEVKKFVGEDGFVEYAVYGIIDHVMVYSLQDMMIAYFKNRKFLDKLLEILWEPVEAETIAALEAGVDVIFTPWYFC